MPERSILFLTHLFPNSANPKLGSFMRNKAVSLQRAGCRVVVVAPIATAPFPLNRLGRYRQYAVPEKSAEMHGVEVHYPRFIRLPGAWFRPWEGWAMTRGSDSLIRKLHARHSFEVVLGGMLTNDGEAARITGRKLGIPAWSYAIGSDIHTYPKNEPRIRSLTEELFRDLDGVIAVGPNFEQTIHREFPGFEEKVICNPIGVDVARFRPERTGYLHEKLGLEDDVRVVLYVGDLSREKGVEELMEMIPGMKDERLFFVLVGKGALLSAIEERVGRGSDFAKCRVFSYLDFEELVRFYQNADLFLFPSHNEGSPTVLIEAASSGLPILASDIPPNHDVVSEERNGSFFPVSDSVAMAEALREFEKRDDLGAMGTASREVALRHFDQEKNGEDLVRLLFG